MRGAMPCAPFPGAAPGPLGGGDLTADPDQSSLLIIFLILFCCVRDADRPQDLSKVKELLRKLKG